MSWGAFWLFYNCPDCGKKFKSDLQLIHMPSSGVCPNCKTIGTFVGESGDTAPCNPNEYEETE